MNGIPIDEFREQLRLRATPITSLNALRTGEEDVPAEYAQMQREIREKKLLDYQLRVKKGDINSFLKSKYSSGDFNQAIFEGYDNSKQRLENGITYEYHVFFPREETAAGIDVHAGKRPPAQYLLTKPLISAGGDSYIYHIPLHIDANGVITTDGEEEEIDSTGASISRDGIVHALETYRKNLAEGRNAFDKPTLRILRQNGFIQDGKFTGAIPNRLVEKYLKNINERNRHNALEYLNAEFDKQAPKEEAPAKEETPIKEEPKEEPTSGEPGEEKPAEAPVVEKPAVKPAEAPTVDKPAPPPPPVKKQGAPIDVKAFQAIANAAAESLLKRLDAQKFTGLVAKYERVVVRDHNDAVESLRNEIKADVNRARASSFDREAFLSKFEPQVVELEDETPTLHKTLEDFDDESSEAIEAFVAANKQSTLFNKDQLKILNEFPLFAELVESFKKAVVTAFKVVPDSFNYNPEDGAFKSQLEDALDSSIKSAKDTFIERGRKIRLIIERLNKWKGAKKEIDEVEELYKDTGINTTLKTYKETADEAVIKFGGIYNATANDLDSVLKTISRDLDTNKFGESKANTAKDTATSKRNLYEKKLEEQKVKDAKAAEKAAALKKQQELKAKAEELKAAEEALKKEKEANDAVINDDVEDEPLKAAKKTTTSNKRK